MIENRRKTLQESDEQEKKKKELEIARMLLNEGYEEEAIMKITKLSYCEVKTSTMTELGRMLFEEGYKEGQQLAKLQRLDKAIELGLDNDSISTVLSIPIEEVKSRRNEVEK